MSDLTKNVVPQDVAEQLGRELLEPMTMTESRLRSIFMSARDRMKRRSLCQQLKMLARYCMSDASPNRRQRLRAVLDEFDSLDKSEGKT